MAHLMARKHKGYSRETTDELYERKVRERERSGIGWPLCRTIDLNMGKQSKCQGCPHFAKGKSPLNLGQCKAVTPSVPTPLTVTSEVTGNPVSAPFDAERMPPRLAGGVYEPICDPCTPQ
jgi:hypothetical protein